MKKTLLIISIFSLFLFANYANAQTRPTVPPLVPDSVTGCTGYENEARCRPEWADSVSKCEVGTLGLGGANTCVTTDLAVKAISPYVMVCSSTYQTAGCIPHKVNMYAANSLARQAEIMGRSLGYTITCSTETLGMAGYVNPINNLTYGLFTSCTINGQSGFDAYTLVNDPARNQSYTNWDVMATELKSIAAAEACGIYKIVYWNTDGSYKCIASPYYTDTCVGAENNNKFNYVTGKSCSISTTPITPQTPTYTAPSTNGWTNSILDLLSKITINLKSQLDAIGKTGGTQTTTSAGTSLQSMASYVSSVSKIINDISANLKNQLNSIGTGQTTTQATTAQNITSSDSIIIDTTIPGTLTFRYLRLDTTEQGWVSWREIEVYGLNSVAVKPVSSKASCVWCGYGATYDTPNPSIDVAPDKTYDNNTQTNWNAGETADNCNWGFPHMRNDGLYGVGCAPWSTRKAWVQLDYGSIQTFSKIRAMQNGNTTSELTRVLVSDDGINFKELTTFKAPMGDMEWMQYPQ